eukprot:2692792-Lingulodinium_polyedra.AAC.1
MVDYNRGRRNPHTLTRQTQEAAAPKKKSSGKAPVQELVSLGRVPAPPQVPLRGKQFQAMRRVTPCGSMFVVLNHGMGTVCTGLAPSESTHACLQGVQQSPPLQACVLQAQGNKNPLALGTQQIQVNKFSLPEQSQVQQ